MQHGPLQRVDGVAALLLLATHTVTTVHSLDVNGLGSRLLEHLPVVICPHTRLQLHHSLTPCGSLLTSQAATPRQMN